MAALMGGEPDKKAPLCCHDMELVGSELRR